MFFYLKIFLKLFKKFFLKFKKYFIQVFKPNVKIFSLQLKLWGRDLQFYLKKNFKKNRFKFSKAFSLLEIILVIFIIAFVFTFVAQKIPRKEQKIKHTFETLIRLNRRLVTSAKLYNNTYRLVIKLDSEGAEQYWVEKKQRQIHRPTSLVESEEVDLESDGHLSENSQEVGDNTEEDSDSENNSGFVMDDFFYSEPAFISPFLDIESVDNSLKEGTQKEGLVYIYYHPKGLAQEVSLHFFRPDNKARWTLYLDPVTKNFEILKKSKI